MITTSQRRQLNVLVQRKEGRKKTGPTWAGSNVVRLRPSPSPILFVFLLKVLVVILMIKIITNSIFLVF